MMRGKCVLALGFLAIALLASGALAAESSAPAGGALEVAAAQAAAKEPAAASAAPVNERVTVLEKENVVLREDLGKARLDTRTQLDDLAKRQAEAIARLQQKLDEANARAEAERQRQARQNRNLWYAVGVVALGLILSN